MKKILIFIIVLITATSCNDSIKIPEKEQSSVTTVEILNGIDSTLQVSIVKEKTIYVINDGVVIAKGNNDNSVSLIALIIGILMGIWIMLLLLVFIE